MVQLLINLYLRLIGAAQPALHQLEAEFHILIHHEEIVIAEHLSEEDLERSYELCC